MDLFQTQTQSHKNSYYNSKHNKKKRLNEDQVRLLERSFTFDKKLEPERKLQLADLLGIPPRQVAVWYQNKRARWRAQTLELDCSALQLKLETALAEKRQLEGDIEMLRGELEMARQSLFAVGVSVVDHQKAHPPPTTVCSVSEGGSSSGSFGYQYVIDHDHGHGHEDQVLQMDHELFASLIDW
ncbi:Octamer-binding transcription factor [Parasponia andersonii]|uniref:Homeobox-leucine zipper protein n=1 Tax=Parasponia andersonii TaxID=3476 RepID=A0A2P5AR38_PARAD|nr:Octamer-binding transcription factor [Parasponia andersonii]